MRSRSFPTRAEALAACKPGELVAARYRVYTDGAREVLEWGVVPAEVVIDQGEGREPVRQPFGDFSENWWSEVEDQVTRERGCTEV